MGITVNGKKVAGNGKPGLPGKSAYQAAQEGGYTGTEAEFNAKMAGAMTEEDVQGIIGGSLAAHIANKNNPHNVTASQIGAIAASQVGNLHVWQRTRVLSETVPAGYTLGDVETDVDWFLFKSGGQGSSSSYYAVIEYSASISVDAAGVVDFVSATQETIHWNSLDTWDEILSSDPVGVFVRLTSDNKNVSSPLLSEVVYFPNGTTAEYIPTPGANETTSHIGYSFSTLQRVDTHGLISAGTYTDYLTSTDEEAYRDDLETAIKSGYTLSEPATINTYISSTTGTLLSCDQSGIRVTSSGEIYGVNGGLTSGKSALYAEYEVGKVYVITSSDNEEILNRWFTPTTTAYGGAITVRFLEPYVEQRKEEVISYLGCLAEGPNVYIGTYIGTGVYGEGNETSITLPFVPSFVEIVAVVSLTGGSGYLTSKEYSLSFDRECVYLSISESDGAVGFANVKADGKTISWYSTGSPSAQYNSGGYIYVYAAYKKGG